MLERLDEQARVEGIKLSAAQWDWLTAEGRGDISEADYERLRGLVVRIVRRERDTPIPDAEPSFCSAIEWAGDQAWPNVVELATAEIAGLPRPPLSLGRRTRNFAGLVLTAILLILCMAALTALLFRE